MLLLFSWSHSLGIFAQGELPNVGWGLSVVFMHISVVWELDKKKEVVFI